MHDGRTTLLTAPAPELENLSFALPEPESVGEWIGRLPMANVPEAAGQIRQATFEIARLETDWATRMALLEGIRPTILYLTARLDKAANSAGASADAITRLAQRLQTNLCSGYKAIVLAAQDAAESDAEACRTVSLAIHRALSDLSRTLLRTLQYYVAPADKLWLTLHQLYLLAETLQIQEEEHADTINDGSPALSIRTVYLRSVLLALARPYQLRHRELSDVFSALSGWGRLTHLSADMQNAIYAVDLSSDKGPGPSKSLKANASCRGIELNALMTELESHLNRTEAGAEPVAVELGLISHLTGAWGEMTSRAFSRADTSEPIQLCVGLKSAHYYLSDNAEFSDTVRKTASTSDDRAGPFGDNVHFLPNAGEAKDVWEDAFDVGGKIPTNPKFEDPELTLFSQEAAADGDALEDPYPCFESTAADMSPSGYRLRWSQPFPPNLQTGELIGLRDQADPRWCLAVARWIRQDEHGPFMGVELLAPQARPVAIRVVQSKGSQAEFQRAFLLPELKPLGRPATLITPASPFKGGQKVVIRENGKQTTAQLGECLLKTGSFNQFSFRVLDGYLEKPGGEPNMGNQINKNQHGFR
jgi:hypothetical protein